MKEQIKVLWRVCLVAIFAIGLGLTAPTVQSYAQTNTNSQITNILCSATNQLTGNIGRSIAVLIVISLAIALFLGKVTWGMAIAVAVGMGILFGAKDVVSLLSPSGATTCS
jgi:type IV secretion system protein VirB2